MTPTEINAVTQALICMRDRLTDRGDRDTLADACNALDAFAKLTRENAERLEDEAERLEDKKEDARTFDEMVNALSEIAHLVGSHGEEDIGAIVMRTRDLVEDYDKLSGLAGAPHVS